MEITTINTDISEVKPDTPCEHCGLPIGPHPAGEGPFFCCSGCLLVYDALQHAGYSKSYYHLRDVAPSSQPATPAKPLRDKSHLLELDTKAFLDNHTRPLSDGNRSVVLFLDGVHCAACVWLVERMPFEIEGVQNARLDLSRAQLKLNFNPDKVQLSSVAAWLARFGYQTYPAHEHKAASRTEAERRLLIKMGISWALAGNVMLFAFAMYAGLDESIIGDHSNSALAPGARWASFLLASISVFYGGSEFFRKAWASLKVSFKHNKLRGLHMDIPISLGILVGFGHSAWATVSGQGDIWFDSITMLIAALLSARWLQLRSRRLAGDASDRLLNLIPSMARLIRSANDDQTGINSENASGQLISVDDLQKDDLIIVPAGEVFPVDGSVASGESMVDKSILTGESRPDKLTAGMWIEAGATNLQAPVRVCVATAGKNTRIGKLLSWIGEREQHRAPVVMLADKLSSYFVGALLLLALATTIGWLLVDPDQTVSRVVALLVISCPCALGMATPLAMAIASGRAARLGIFIKSDQATQQLTEVDAVVMDKTGTLTQGRMSIVEFAGDEKAISIAAALEQHSNHPIARAIIEKAGTYVPVCQPVDTSINSFTAVPGNGIKGIIEDKQILVGRPSWVLATSTTDSFLENKLKAYAEAGHTPVAIAINGNLTTVLAIGDQIRVDAINLLQSLENDGKIVYLLSGDHPAVVQQVAESLNIPLKNAFGDVSPEGKQRFIKQLQEDEKYIVAMVGDGVNDAAALQTADVGIAVEGGSTPSQVAANVFLTRNGLQSVVDVFFGAGKVMTVIRRTLGFSSLYNLAGASAAILGFVTPLVAAIAMPVSSLIVVLASIFQQSFSPHHATKR